MILVTGGTGLVGSHLLYHLVNKGKKIKAIYRDDKKLDTVKKVFSYYSSNAHQLFDEILWVKADIVDIPKLTEVFEGITSVYHCAALVSFEPQKYHLLRKVNIEGTANIVNLCLDFNIEKLCYVSSIATLGKSLNNELITEETYWNHEEDNNVYAITKYGAEMEMWRGTQEGLKVIIVNPGIILGEGLWNQGSGYLFKKIHEGLTYHTKGGTGYVDVKDVVSIMIQLMESSIANERYILISENCSSKRILTLIATSLNAKIPSKVTTQRMLEIGWRFDWLANKLTGKKRLLTKQLAKNLNIPSFYSNDKITKGLEYTFIPVEKSIERVSEKFLLDH